MMNGNPRVESTHRFLTTVAYHIHSGGYNDGYRELDTVYALEGNVFYLGTAMQWLKENLGTIEDVIEVEVLVEHMDSKNGFYFYQVFAVFLNEYWRLIRRIVSVI